MARPYSMDLRERVVAAVTQEGQSRNQAANRFGVAISTAVKWLERYETTGSVAPGQMGGQPAACAPSTARSRRRSGAWPSRPTSRAGSASSRSASQLSPSIAVKTVSCV